PLPAFVAEQALCGRIDLDDAPLVVEEQHALFEIVEQHFERRERNHGVRPTERSLNENIIAAKAETTSAFFRTARQISRLRELARSWRIRSLRAHRPFAVPERE